MFSVAITLAALHAGVAQDPSLLQRRLARINQLRREADVSLTRAEARRDVLDTIRAGGLLILVRAADASIVRRAAELAWLRLDSLYGDEAATLANRPILFWFITREVRFPPHSIRQQPVMADPASTQEDVVRQLVIGAAATLRGTADSTLNVWLGSTLTPMNNPTAELGRIYVDLVTAPSAAVRRCYLGDAPSCLAALGLLDGGDPATLWYDAAERRAVVSKATWATWTQTTQMRAPSNACLIGHSDEACLQVMHAMRYLEPPLTTESRHSFVRLALRTGGHAAYGRLLHSTGPLSERVAIAAGLPADSLATRWRATILEARPKTVTLVAAAAWTALAWTVVFGLLALRSTRWR